MVDVGTKVKAVKSIGSGLTQAVPLGSEGIVVAHLFDGRLDVRFTLPGLLGGTRSVNVHVAVADVAAL
ncbi:hypothetical protein [Embleya sp. NBC_00896]|uniref:hypothetical protein n=1 Tax=Embleya sp. NBC_00896 TaxID=2975961 RepID=UPI002F919489|nr:hypothetical protein OG928_39395 [Embleya sp. NBC_00896]